jgi:hypothetical protein
MNKKIMAIAFLTVTILFVSATRPSMINAQTTTYYSGREYAGNGPVAFTLTMCSPTNQTTYSKIMSLDFQINWTAIPELLPINNWVFGENYSYSIDNNQAVSIMPNSSLTTGPSASYWFSNSLDISNLTNGYHKIMIIALMYFGQNTLFNQSTVPVTFLVQNPTPSPTPTSTIPEFPSFAIIVLITVVGSSLIILKRKDNASLDA